MKKNLLVLIALALFSCSKSSRTSSDPFPHYVASDDEWITYEGILPCEIGNEVLAELHLLPGSPGIDSYYKLHESMTLSEPRPAAVGIRSEGRYSVLSASAGRRILEIHHRRLIGAMPPVRHLGKIIDATDHLYLESRGDHELMLVDENFQLVDGRYRLIRRSKLFTIEGYFTVYPDTTDYFERNTLEKWPVAQLASYHKAVSQYHALAREPHEGIYLKALAYSVRLPDRNGKERDMLVFKRILQMGSTNESDKSL